jgi:hypothetical protein
MKFFNHSKRTSSTSPHRLLATGASMALVVQAPVAAAAPRVSNLITEIGVLPFAGDVFTIGSNGTLIAVDPSSTQLSAPLFNLAGEPLNLTWGQFAAATAKSYAWTVTHHETTYTRFLVGLSGLVPNGVYSLFYRTFGPDSTNALRPNVEPSVALTAAFRNSRSPTPTRSSPAARAEGCSSPASPRTSWPRNSSSSLSSTTSAATRTGRLPTSRSPRPRREQRRTLPLELRHRRDAPVPDHPEVTVGSAYRRGCQPATQRSINQLRRDQ